MLLTVVNMCVVAGRRTYVGRFRQLEKGPGRFLYGGVKTRNSHALVTNICTPRTDDLYDLFPPQIIMIYIYICQAGKIYFQSCML